MTLEQWQTRLHTHFAAMAKTRSVSGDPVFALEHGLDDAERRSLASDIRASLLVRPPSDAYWLPWIVYATEVGYTYDGEEYWQTFEEITPRWATCRSRPRDWLRDRFVRFERAYRGVKPSGSWATHFSIIAWPIQHAILPVYLQYHLAKLLYDLRYDLTPQLLTDPTALGQYLHAESSRSVNRLQEFTEEHALVGTIAKALLLSGNELSNVSILPKTLQRLLADLEKEQHARDWLRLAQAQARGVSLRGMIPKTSSAKTTSPSSTITKSQVPELEGRIMLVPEANDEWSVYFETPDLTALTTRLPHFRSILAGSRCTVGVGGGRWQARGWLLYGPHRVPLPAWPQPDEVLLILDKGDATLSALFRAGFLLRPGTTWLFRIGPDGIGHEIRNLAVRAGQRYLVLKTAGALPIEEPAMHANVRCSGIKAAIVNVPPLLDQHKTNYLEGLGLNVWQTIRVWPAGLSAAAWDGEGRSEWLVGEPVLVGISSDKPIQKVQLTLDGTSPVNFMPASQSAPLFVALPQLDLGVHELRVQIQSAGRIGVEQTGLMEFLIRPPRARLDAYKSLFRAAVDPERSSLDDFWRGAVSIDVHGPEKRSVIPRLELASGFGLSALAQKTLPPMLMPVTATAWKAAFREHCIGDLGLDNHFDEAKECRLNFDAGELGASTVRFERERPPLRWNVRRTNQGFRLRLVNEARDDDATFVDLFSYEQPDQAVTRPGTDFAAAVAVPPPSGLFMARNYQAEAGIILPPALVLRGFASLGLNLKLTVRRPQPDQIAAIIRAYERWANARIIHDALAFSFRVQVLSTMESAISDLFYQETKILGRTAARPDEAGLSRLSSSIKEYSVRALLPSLRSEAFSRPTHERSAYIARLVFPLLSCATAIPSPDPNNGQVWISEFALRLASAPDRLSYWAKERLQPGLQFLLKYSTIVCVARYLVLAGDVANGARPLTAGPLRDSWEW